MIKGKMPFGKWRGVWIFDLPAEYVEWIAANVDLKPPLHAQFVRFWGHKFTFRIEEVRWTASDEPPTTPAINWPALRRKFAARFHPDLPGGSREAMTAVNAVFDELEALV